VRQLETAAAARLIKTDKMSDVPKSWISPIGRTAQEAAEERGRGSAAYRAERARYATSGAIAKQVIHLRTIKRITQSELARRAETSYSQISRIESGRHQISHDTFKRVFRALGVTPLVGYERPARRGRPAQRELIAL
jgi:ribosome-binding protein aMBF1 (putative translation factor)